MGFIAMAGRARGRGSAIWCRTVAPVNLMLTPGPLENRPVVRRRLQQAWKIIRRFFSFFGFEVHRSASTPEALAVRLLIDDDVDLVIDVGAGTGQYGNRLRRFGYEARIVSFEPLPSQHRKLKARAATDELWAVPPPLALGSTEGTERIVVSSDRVSSSLLEATPRLLEAAHDRLRPERCQTVTVSTLSHLWQRWTDGASRIFVKIDVQGYEAEVLAGARAVMDEIMGFQVEVSLVELYEGQPMALDVMNRLAGHGYRLRGVIPGLVDRSSGEMLQVDLVFVRASQ